MNWVYFIQHGGAQGDIKIGTTSKHPRERLRALQTGAPLPLRLLAFVPGDASLEHEMHQKFKEFRIREDGEWFRAETPLVWFINGIQWAMDQAPRPAPPPIKAPVLPLLPEWDPVFVPRRFREDGQ